LFEESKGLSDAYLSFVVCTAAPVQESPTIYSVFLQENQKDRKSEKDQPAPVVRPSGSASAVMMGTNKKNVQLSKKASEKKKDMQYTLEDALQQVSSSLIFLKLNMKLYLSVIIEVLAGLTIFMPLEQCWRNSFFGMSVNSSLITYGIESMLT